MDPSSPLLPRPGVWQRFLPLKGSLFKHVYRLLVQSFGLIRECLVSKQHAVTRRSHKVRERMSDRKKMKWSVCHVAPMGLSFELFVDYLL